MDITIKKLTNEMVDEYINFFDNTPHDTYEDAHKCYCIWFFGDEYQEEDLSDRYLRREFAKIKVKSGKTQGYFAYLDGKPVGWVNTNSKHACSKCAGGKSFMKHSFEGEDKDKEVKSIYCYVVHPDYQRKGIATKLLKQVIEDARLDGYKAVEVYPWREGNQIQSTFGGYMAMYERLGFYMYNDHEVGPIMRLDL